MAEDTTPLTTKISYKASVIKMQVSQLMYQLEPWQRALIIASIVIILPGYWIIRWGTYGTYSIYYYTQRLVPHQSFSNPEGLKLTSPTLLKLANGKFSATANITNPNLDLSIDNGEITWQLLDADGNTIFEENQNFFLLPGQKQVLAVTNARTDITPSKAKIILSQAHWQKRFEIPSVELVNPPAKIHDEQNNDGTITFDGFVTNTSPYKLKETHLLFIALDKSGAQQGVIDRTEKDLASGEARSFPVVMPIINPATKIDRIITYSFSNPLDKVNLHRQ